MLESCNLYKAKISLESQPKKSLMTSASVQGLLLNRKRFQELTDKIDFLDYSIVSLTSSDNLGAERLKARRELKKLKPRLDQEWLQNVVDRASNENGVLRPTILGYIRTDLKPNLESTRNMLIFLGDESITGTPTPYDYKPYNLTQSTTAAEGLFALAGTNSEMATQSSLLSSYLLHSSGVHFHLMESLSCERGEMISVSKLFDRHELQTHDKSCIEAARITLDGCEPIQNSYNYSVSLSEANKLIALYGNKEINNEMPDQKDVYLFVSPNFYEEKTYIKTTLMEHAVSHLYMQNQKDALSYGDVNALHKRASHILSVDRKIYDEAVNASYPPKDLTSAYFERKPRQPSANMEHAKAQATRDIQLAKAEEAKRLKL